MLTVENLRINIFGNIEEVTVVDEVNFQINRGEIFALLGESGCGKSLTALSLMRLLPNAARIASGRIYFDGKNLLNLTEPEMRYLRGRRLAMIFQEPQSALNPVMTIGAQIAESLRYYLGLNGAALRSRLIELFEQVGISDPELRLDEYPHQFSGGMKQRAMIAMALARQPELLIADEPTTALDVTLQAQILRLIKRLVKEQGMSLLLISHDLGVVHDMADNVAVMYAGKFVEQAPSAAFFAKPYHPYTRKLFAALPQRDQRDQPLAVIPGILPSKYQKLHGCRFAPRCELAWQHCHNHYPRQLQLQNTQVVCHLHDSELTQPPQSPIKTNAIVDKTTNTTALIDGRESPLLDVRKLIMSFPIRKGILSRITGQIHAVDSVSFNIYAGQTLALVGESGCGKTTLGKGILQLQRPESGRVLFAGVDLTWLSGEALRRRRRHLQIVFQDPYSSMNPRMKIGEIIGEGMIALGVIDKSADRTKRIVELLEQVGLNVDMLNRYPHEFSGGQRQRIALARALAVAPQLIVCDEITSALDVSIQAQIINLLKELQNQFRIAYLFVTHNLGLVEYLAHNVAVMYLGRIVEQGTVNEVLKTPKHPYTSALLAAVPVISPRINRKIFYLTEKPASSVIPPTGCYFHPRCPEAQSICAQHYPCTAALTDTHLVNCHLYL